MQMRRSQWDTSTDTLVAWLVLYEQSLLIMAYVDCGEVLVEL